MGLPEVIWGLLDTSAALATAGLLVLSGPLTRALGRVLPAPVAAIIALPCAAQAACQPGRTFRLGAPK